MAPRRLALLSILPLLIALGGCGDDSDQADKQEAAKAPTAVQHVRVPLNAAATPPRSPANRRAQPRGVAPQAVEPLADALSAFRKAAASGDCDELLALRHNAERGGNIGAPATAEECERFKANGLSIVKDSVPVASERFGPAAVVDYTRNGDQVTGLWLVQANGRWGYLIDGGFLAHNVGSRPNPSDKFDEGVNGFIRASQQRDCAAGFRFLNPNSNYVFGNRTSQEYCDFVNPRYDQKYNFFNMAAANPSEKPRPLGKTRLYGLYEIDLGPTYWILVGRVTPGNLPPEQTEGHIEDGFQSMYSGSYAPAS